MQPKVSVLMAVYNGERYLRESVESMLNQTFTDFEFIIIDDSSTDSTWEILTEYINRDQRIRLFKNEANIGLTKSLNKGLKLAQGKYIARQDVDDISLPERLEKQVSYMESHQSVALVSTGVQYIDDAGNKTWAYIPPKDLALLRWQLLFRNPIRHPTVLWRRELIDSRIGGYDPSFTYSQDHDLWARIAEHLIIDTLPLILVEMLRHNESISSTKTKAQDDFVARVTHRRIVCYLPAKHFTEQDVDDILVMRPGWKNDFQRQHLASLSASRFRQAAYHYLQLWQQFCVTSDVIRNPLSLQVLQQEMEQSLVELLIHCKQKQWFMVGCELVWFYLRNCPSRILALTLTLLRRLVPSTLLLWYRSLRTSPVA